MADKGYHGHMTMADGSHVPLTAEQASGLWEQTERHQAEIAARLPDEAACLRAMSEAFHRLRDFGWREAMYCPKDGSSFDAIEAGSSGVHRCYYSGEWPDGRWYVEDGGDIWPSTPILFRLDPEAEAERKRKMEAAAEAYQAERRGRAYPEFCHGDNPPCLGKGYCPRDPNCAE